MDGPGGPHGRAGGAQGPGGRGGPSGRRPWVIVVLLAGLGMRAMRGDDGHWRPSMPWTMASRHIGDHPWRVAIGDHPRRVAIGDHPRRVAIGDHPWRVAIGDHPWRVAIGDHPWRPSMATMRGTTRAVRIGLEQGAWCRAQGAGRRAQGADVTFAFVFNQGGGAGVRWREGARLIRGPRTAACRPAASASGRTPTSGRPKRALIKALNFTLPLYLKAL